MSQGVVLSPLETNAFPPSPTMLCKRRGSSLESSQELKKAKALSPDEKMQKNFFKAIAEHNLKKEELPELEPIPPKAPIYLHVQSNEKQGIREEMEDAHIHSEFEQGSLLGIFDGHGDKGAIAKFAALMFEMDFPILLAQRPHDIKGIFKEICEDAHSKVTQEGGTTALVCFFDKATHRIYTATLGDSEAKIYRRKEGKIYSIPLSCVRNWCSKRDMKRMESVLDNPELFTKWTNIEESKFRRFPLSRPFVNVSRSIGDKSLQINGKSAISQKPKSTSSQFLPGDLLVMACDGLWDFIPSEQELIDKVLSPCWGLPDICDAITNYVLRDCKGRDNVTVISAWASEDSTPPELPSTQPLSEETQPF